MFAPTIGARAASSSAAGHSSRASGGIRSGSSDERGESSDGLSWLAASPSRSTWSVLLSFGAVVTLLLFAMQCLSRLGIVAEELKCSQRSNRHNSGYTLCEVWQDIRSLSSCLLGALIACGFSHFSSSASPTSPSSASAASYVDPVTVFRRDADEVTKAKCLYAYLL
mmetsp:Transcript_23280/g.62173  ORF Transcript_23280/g.62173 Transcript_23280/m.62173 type:complete len:167 (+) Transcript_23280:56-556(+)|eukprot:CAMPEP_0115235476 /NCGR_PEP_ID=MMETSP0270-20121206/35337_1 /TAXON_ID=71861 /ORGANISM="Scrippsiella trochoidea, Strain CCMP3099" /LENGTH=166 /DNA_ID=CAMNT_0002650273 /DNA_START=56 /DNA_END=556 /DNA_ORIENTATION=-